MSQANGECFEIYILKKYVRFSFFKNHFGGKRMWLVNCRLTDKGTPLTANLLFI